MQTVVDAALDAWALIDNDYDASHGPTDRFVRRLATHFLIWDLLCLSRPVRVALVPLTLKIVLFVVQPYFCAGLLHLPHPEKNLSYGKCSSYMACLR